MVSLPMIDLPRGGALQKPKHVDKRNLKQIQKSRIKRNITQEDSFQRMFGRFDKINYKSLCIGMKFLGIIKAIHDYEMKITLPGRLIGTLPITQISQSFNTILKSYTGRTDMEEDYIKLRNNFIVGQWLQVQIIDIQLKGNNKHTFILSCRPDILNSSLSIQDIQKNLILNCAISTIEDYGYTLETGLSVKAFLNDKFAKKYLKFWNKGIKLNVGQHIPCRILEKPKDMNQKYMKVAVYDGITINDDSSSTFNMLCKNVRLELSKFEPESVDAFLPGSIISVTITQKYTSKCIIVNTAKSNSEINPTHNNIDEGKYVTGYEVCSTKFGNKGYMSSNLSNPFGWTPFLGSSQLDDNTVHGKNLIMSAILTNLYGSKIVKKIQEDTNAQNNKQLEKDQEEKGRKTKKIKLTSSENTTNSLSLNTHNNVHFTPGQIVFPCVITYVNPITKTFAVSICPHLLQSILMPMRCGLETFTYNICIPRPIISSLKLFDLSKSKRIVQLKQALNRAKGRIFLQARVMNVIKTKYFVHSQPDDLLEKHDLKDKNISAVDLINKRTAQTYKYQVYCALPIKIVSEDINIITTNNDIITQNNGNDTIYLYGFGEWHVNYQCPLEKLYQNESLTNIKENNENSSKTIPDEIMLKPVKKQKLTKTTTKPNKKTARKHSVKIGDLIPCRILDYDLMLGCAILDFDDSKGQLSRPFAITEDSTMATAKKSLEVEISKKPYKTEFPLKKCAEIEKWIYPPSKVVEEWRTYDNVMIGAIIPECRVLRYCNEALTTLSNSNNGQIQPNLLTGSGVLVQINEHIRGFIPLLHLSDTALLTELITSNIVQKVGSKKLRILQKEMSRLDKHRQRYFVPGKVITCRVLDCWPDQTRLLLTHKKSLINCPHEPLLISYALASNGIVTRGYIVNYVPAGVRIAFYCSVKGLLPLKECADIDLPALRQRIQGLNREEEGKQIVQALRKAYPLGKVLNLQVTYVDIENKRLSLKMYLENGIMARKVENQNKSSQVTTNVNSDAMEKFDEGKTLENDVLGNNTQIIGRNWIGQFFHGTIHQSIKSGSLINLTPLKENGTYDLGSDNNTIRGIFYHNLISDFGDVNELLHQHLYPGYTFPRILCIGITPDGKLIVTNKLSYKLNISPNSESSPDNDDPLVNELASIVSNVILPFSARDISSTVPKTNLAIIDDLQLDSFCMGYIQAIKENGIYVAFPDYDVRGILYKKYLPAALQKHLFEMQDDKNSEENNVPNQWRHLLGQTIIAKVIRKNTDSEKTIKTIGLRSDLQDLKIHHSQAIMFSDGGLNLLKQYMLEKWSLFQNFEINDLINHTYQVGKDSKIEYSTLPNYQFYDIKSQITDVSNNVCSQDTRHLNVLNNFDNILAVIPCKHDSLKTGVDSCISLLHPIHFEDKLFNSVSNHNLLSNKRTFFILASSVMNIENSASQNHSIISYDIPQLAEIQYIHAERYALVKFLNSSSDLNSKIGIMPLIQELFEITPSEELFSSLQIGKIIEVSVVEMSENKNEPYKHIVFVKFHRVDTSMQISNETNQNDNTIIRLNTQEKTQDTNSLSRMDPFILDNDTKHTQSTMFEDLIGTSRNRNYCLYPTTQTTLPPIGTIVSSTDIGPKFFVVRKRFNTYLTLDFCNGARVYIDEIVRAWKPYLYDQIKAYYASVLNTDQNITKIGGRKITKYSAIREEYMDLAEKEESNILSLDPWKDNINNHKFGDETHVPFDIVEDTDVMELIPEGFIFDNAKFKVISHYKYESKYTTISRSFPVLALCLHDNDPIEQPNYEIGTRVNVFAEKVTDDDRIAQFFITYGVKGICRGIDLDYDIKIITNPSLRFKPGRIYMNAIIVGKPETSYHTNKPYVDLSAESWLQISMVANNNNSSANELNNLLLVPNSIIQATFYRCFTFHDPILRLWVFRLPKQNFGLVSLFDCDLDIMHKNAFKIPKFGMHMQNEFKKVEKELMKDVENNDEEIMSDSDGSLDDLPNFEILPSLKINRDLRHKELPMLYTGKIRYPLSHAESFIISQELNKITDEFQQTKRKDVSKKDNHNNNSILRIKSPFSSMAFEEQYSTFYALELRSKQLTDPSVSKKCNGVYIKVKRFIGLVKELPAGILDVSLRDQIITYFSKWTGASAKHNDNQDKNVKILAKLTDSENCYHGVVLVSLFPLKIALFARNDHDSHKLLEDGQWISLKHFGHGQEPFPEIMYQIETYKSSRIILSLDRKSKDKNMGTVLPKPVSDLADGSKKFDWWTPSNNYQNNDTKLQNETAIKFTKEAEIVTQISPLAKSLTHNKETGSLFSNAELLPDVTPQSLEDIENSCTKKHISKRAAKRMEEKLETDVFIQQHLASTTSQDSTTAGVFDSIPALEKEIITQPNNSFLWTRLLALHVKGGDVEKGRLTAKKALETISLRESQERLNIWIALLNLELLCNAKGNLSPEFTQTLEEALRCNDTEQTYLALITIYIRNGMIEFAHDTYRKILSLTTKSHSNTEKFDGMDIQSKKIPNTIKTIMKSPQVWMSYVEFLFKHCRRPQQAREMLEKMFIHIDKKQHVELVVKFALLEFDYGHAERAKTMFTKTLQSYPKRMDVWFRYLDALLKRKLLTDAKNVLNDLSTTSFDKKSRRSIYKRLVDFEVKYGTFENLQKIKESFSDVAVMA